jgi:DNA polymerase-1
MILIIDGNNLASINNATPALTTKDGFPSQGIYGFARSLSAYARDLAPSKVIVCWDGGRSSVRKKLHPEYKAIRDEVTKKDPDMQRRYQDFIKQIPYIQMIAVLTGCISIRGRGVEADDLIALLVKKFSDTKEMAILSTDKDFYQLVSDKVWIFNPVSKKRITMKNFEDVIGLKLPRQFLEMRMMTGETGTTSDNIPGIQGVGDATAKKILTIHDTLENFFKVKGEVNFREQKVLDNIPLVRRNRILMDLSVPELFIKRQPTITHKPLNEKGLLKLFKRFEMQSLVISIKDYIEPFM